MLIDSATNVTYAESTTKLETGNRRTVYVYKCNKYY